MAVSWVCQQYTALGGHAPTVARARPASDCRTWYHTAWSISGASRSVSLSQQFWLFLQHTEQSAVLFVAWTAVHGRRWMQGCAWKAVHGRLCMVALHMLTASIAVIDTVCCAAEVVQKEGTKLASRQEFAKRVALDLFRYVLPCFPVLSTCKIIGVSICFCAAAELPLSQAALAANKRKTCAHPLCCCTA